MKKFLSILIAVVMCFGMVSTVFAAEMNFTDVHEDDWYYEDVKYAVENGLINGKTENLFAPASSLTGSEAIKLAACIHQLYVEGSVSLKSGFPWYKPYVDYCKENGIIAEDKNYPLDRPITRGDFVVIFANALPEEAYTQINDIEYGEIPDVEEGREYYEPAYKLYRAGILTGSGEAHKLFPDNPIVRAEVAAIVTRMVDESRRVEFTFEKKEDEAPKEENTENKDDTEENNSFVNVNVTITPDDSENIQGNVNITDGSKNDNANSSEDDIIYGEVNTGENVTVGNVVITPDPDNTVVNGEVSTNQGNTNVSILGLSIKLQPTSFKITAIPARATFTVEATGGVGPYTYQWEYKTDTTLRGKWLKMPEPNTREIKAGTAKWLGSETATLTVPVTKDNAPNMTKAKFRCVITDANGNKVTSDVVGFDIGKLDLTSIKGLR
jgi:hypothetical protein